MAGDVILLTGPTASGKSGVALALARELDGVIVNADSMQVYADLRVLTARPSEEEARQAPHLLFGHVDGAVNYSAGRWLAAVETALSALEAQGKVAILCGGTGLYFKALTQGLSAIPAVPDAIRARVRAEAEGRTPPELHGQLAALDPLTAARVRPSDPQRILRALEVFEATGQPLASFQGRREPPRIAPGAAPRFFLAPDRAWLNARIDARFAVMLRQGALDEVQALAARALDLALPVMRAHGMPALLAHLRGEITLAEAATRACLDTRHYAKRQATFARHQLADFTPLAPEGAAERIVSEWRLWKGAVA